MTPAPHDPSARRIQPWLVAGIMLLLLATWMIAGLALSALGAAAILAALAPTALTAEPQAARRRDAAARFLPTRTGRRSRGPA